MEVSIQTESHETLTFSKPGEKGVYNIVHYVREGDVHCYVTSTGQRAVGYNLGIITRPATGLAFSCTYFFRHSSASRSFSSS